MKTIGWMRNLLEIRQAGGAKGLEGWRQWLISVLAFVMAVVILPFSFALTFPLFLAKQHYLLIALDCGLYALALWHVVRHGQSFMRSAGWWLALLYLMTFSFFYFLGPHYARAAWLVFCAVMVAVCYGTRMAVAATGLSILVLMALYTCTGLHHPAWVDAHQRGIWHYLSFCINTAMLGLGAALPVGFLLARLSDALESERHARQRLAGERDRLMATKQSLEMENMERRKVEAALRDSEERLRSLQDNVPVGVYRATVDGRVLAGNPAMADMLGLASVQELLALNVPALYQDPRDRTRFLQQLARHGVVRGFETRFKRPGDGKGVWVSINARGLGDDAGVFQYIDGTIEEITRRRRAENAILDEKRFSEALLNSLPGIFFLYDPHMKLVRWNRNHELWTGFSGAELRGRTILDGLVSEDRDKVRAVVEKVMAHGNGSVEARFKAKTGSRVDYLLTAVRLERSDGPYLLGIGIDISPLRQAQEEKQRLETQLRHVQKAEAIGTLAGGIAHDFNNILGGIIGFTELAEEQLPDAAAARRSLERVLQAGQRAKELVQQILHFSRQTEAAMRPLKIGVVVEEALHLLRASIPANIEIRRQIRDNNEMVMADATRIHQMIMNLCTNAAHAMRTAGGRLEVALESHLLTAPLTCHGQELTPGSYLRLEVTDDGCGIPPDKMDRIFDPYFTTKPVTEGTGLGLAVTLGIVRGHGGGIQVASQPGRGTRVAVHLPCIEAAPETVTTADKGVAPGGRERILFVDDEAFYVELNQKVLGQLGYSVAAGQSSLSALERFMADPDYFDLVVTDQSMPKMTGLELAHRIHAIRPQIPIILCTGFSEAVNPGRVKPDGIARILYKPVRRKDLADAIRQVLDQEEGI